MTVTTDTDVRRHPSAPSRRGIVEWDVERADFWRSTGSKIAFRNLLISIPCLLFAFAIWLYWSIIIVQMENLGFPFSTSELFSVLSELFTGED